MMLEKKVQLNVLVSHELSQILEGIAADAGSTPADVIRQALALMKVAHDAKAKGQHIGIADDPEKLDTEIIGLL